LNDSSLQPDGQALGYFQDAEDVVYLPSAAPSATLFLSAGCTAICRWRSRWHYGKNSPPVFAAEQRFGPGLDLGAMLNFSLERLLDSDFLGQVTLAFSALDIARTPILWNTRHEDRVQRTMLLGLGYAEDFGMRDGRVQLFYTRIANMKRPIWPAWRRAIAAWLCAPAWGRRDGTWAQACAGAVVPWIMRSAFSISAKCIDSAVPLPLKREQANENFLLNRRNRPAPGSASGL
jgi:hypothetical protein